MVDGMIEVMSLWFLHAHVTLRKRLSRTTLSEIDIETNGVHTQQSDVSLKFLVSNIYLFKIIVLKYILQSYAGQAIHNIPSLWYNPKEFCTG